MPHRLLRNRLTSTRIDLHQLQHSCDDHSIGRQEAIMWFLIHGLFLMFFMLGFGADRKSSIVGVWAAPAAGKTQPKACIAPPFGRVFPTAGAAQTHPERQQQSPPVVCESGKSHIGGSGDRFEPYRCSAVQAGIAASDCRPNFPNLSPATSRQHNGDKCGQSTRLTANAAGWAIVVCILQIQAHNKRNKTSQPSCI